MRANWAAPLLGLVLPGLVLLGSGCGGQPRPADELRNIQEDRHRIADPSRLHALATGIGCGGTRQDALTSAQRVAQFNLRSLTGEARYLVEFAVLRELPEPQRYCVEVSARAVP
jgi:hypothetical protein